MYGMSANNARAATLDFPLKSISMQHVTMETVSVDGQFFNIKCPKSHGTMRYTLQALWFMSHGLQVYGLTIH